ncbi:MAG: ribbon-helix-helix protein, CopG family [Tepidiformaceae bacterium]
MRTSLNLDESLMRAVRSAAARRGTTPAAIIEEALRRELVESVPKSRVTFPTSAEAGTGGLQLPAGIDFNDTSAVLDYLDALDAAS